MEIRQLGPSGIAVSAVGLGCNNLGRPGAPTEDQIGSSRVIGAALEAGVTFFDTADIYGKEFGLSERLLGRALGSHRDEAIIATKFGHSGTVAPDIPPGLSRGSRGYVRAAVENSLRRLGTDYIDVYIQHVPDPDTPVVETLAALGELVAEGKVRAVANSNFDAVGLRAADAEARRIGVPAFTAAQNDYSLLNRAIEAEVLPTARELGLGLLPFFPLFNGLLTGKFTRTERPADSRIARQRPHIADEADWDQLEAFAAFCADRGITMVEASFGWLLSRAEVSSVIAGATTPAQVAQNAATASGWRPAREDLSRIDEIFPAPEPALTPDED